MLGAGKVTGDAIRQQEIDCLALMDEVWLWRVIFVSIRYWLRSEERPLCHPSATAEAAESQESTQARAFQR